MAYMSVLISALLAVAGATRRPDLDPERRGPVLRDWNLTSAHNPWASNCNRSLHDYAGCIVSDRESLPTVHETLNGKTAYWEIAYIRALFPRSNQLLPNARGYHGAVFVMSVGTGEVFLMGYFVYSFGLNMAIPIPTEHGFKWENQAALSWFPSWIRSPFDYFDSVWPLGRASGKVVNQWLDTLPGWIHENSGYRLLSLWSQPGINGAERFVEESTCHTLCEYSFKTLYNLGADFASQPGSQFPLCRNYAAFITDTPAIVDIADPTKHKLAEAWYESQAKCFFSWYFTGKTCSKEFAKQKYAFGVDAKGQYHEGILHKPYFQGFADDRYMEQRMLLPWQNYQKDTRLGECVFPESQTSLSRDMNKMIARGQTGVYTGGFGVLVRNPFDGLSSNHLVTPATLWVNDIFTPSQLYPSTGGDPACPNKGTDGWLKTKACDEGPWDYAQIGVLVGYSFENFFPNWKSMQDEDWDGGVFYSYDSNAVDKRCRYLPDIGIYDCPGGYIDLNTWTFHEDQTKIGAGGYPAGNPEIDPSGGKGSSGGGAGCHFEPTKKAVDQTDAVNAFGENLVIDHHCRCNNKAYGKDWNEWVDNWLLYAKPHKEFDYQGWFSKGKAPGWGGDIAACWHNNPRDMINLQNALWWRRWDWSNQLNPLSSWQGSLDPVSNRPYWGWNEVPVDRAMMDDPGNWDAVLIKLPAAACGKSISNDDSVECLSQKAMLALEADLTKYINHGYLVPGADSYSNKPGSSVLFARETADMNGNYNKEFFCQPWTSPNKLYNIVFISDKGPAPEGTGACYIEMHAGPSNIHI